MLLRRQSVLDRQGQPPPGLRWWLRRPT